MLGIRWPYRMKKIVKSLIYRGGRYWCPVCRHAVPYFKAYDCIWPERENEICPVCRSFSRHRFMWMCLEQADLLVSGMHVLEFAPSSCITTRLRKLGAICTTTDLCMPGVDVHADICQLPFDVSSFDFVLCSMVLEHIEDDLQAMREVFRVLRNGGVAFFIVPLRDGSTLEDPTVIETEERLKVFGQEDHVRYYGFDIEARLDSVGFEVKVMTSGSELDEEVLIRQGIAEDDVIFVCKKKECP